MTPAACIAVFACLQDTPVFRGGATLVRVDVEVRRGADPVRGLQPEDFLLKDEGRVRPIRHFAAESAALDLVLVMDVSGSLRNAVDTLARSAGEVLDKLAADDRVALLTFAGDVRVELPLTGDREAAAAALERLLREPLRPGTSLYQAAAAAGAVVSAEGGRPAVLMITDNRSVEPRSREAHAVRALLRAGASLNVLVIPTAGPQRLTDSVRLPGLPPPEDLRRIASRTGGEVAEVDDLAAALPRWLDRIRMRYSLLFTPEPAGDRAFRRIAVELSADARKRLGKGITLRAREGYYPQ
ncbi:MAG: VWA domain-containing protein [Bryobacteraceae bacterium]|nr:VWA domain-containing protein [Bryobacteraceae bacterium]